MIDFQALDLTQAEKYHDYLLNCGERGCEYNLANLYIWGRQKAALFPGGIAFFSHFNRQSVYLFPILRENHREVLDAVIADAMERDISCRFTCLTEQDCALLEELYPGRFTFHNDRDDYDYVYDIEKMSTLKGKKLQRKRNHLNKFKLTHPGYTVESITDENTPEIQVMLDEWYGRHLEKFPEIDTCMEQVAIHKALRYREKLGMEGILIRWKGEILAMTMGSPISDATFDVQFEKANDESAYVAINYEFARYLKIRFPHLLWLNREEDMGLEGLRKAKLSYHPDKMVEKKWANLTEAGDDD